MSGWTFDNLAITVQRQLCEALFAAGRAKKASELVLEMIHTSRREVYMSGAVKWVSGELIPHPF